MLKVGGKLSYSTCSLNPVEDEAVVASALKQFKGCIELEQVSLPGFKFREGLTQWKVMTEKVDPTPEDTEQKNFFEVFETFDQIPQTYHRVRCLKDTMFANNYDESIISKLPKCLRVLPHD